MRGPTDPSPYHEASFWESYFRMWPKTTITITPQCVTITDGETTACSQMAEPDKAVNPVQWEFWKDASSIMDLM